MIRRHEGFSLLEILVAFAIMAVALTVVLRIFGSGVNNAVLSEEYTLAVQVAESLMARVGVESPIQAGEYTGTEGDRYDWRVTISPVAKIEADTQDTDTQAGALEAAQDTSGLELLSVNVSVSWGEEDGEQRSMALNSLKAAQIEPQQQP